MQLAIQTPSVTMTSLELVDYINSLESRRNLTHANFLAKAPKVLGDGGLIQFQDTYKHPQNGQMYPMYRFPKREACLMAMSYSYDLQAKVFDKMTELEARPIDPMQILSDPAAMRGLLLGYTEKVLSLECTVAELSPKAEALDRMTIADGEVCLQVAGKLLQQPPNKFIAWLRSLGTWIFKRPGSSRNSAYTDKINAGYLNVRATTTIMPDGSERVTEQVVVTPKGLTKLAQMLGVAQIGGVA